MTPPPESDRPRLLFVTPTWPDAQGNGLAMRAGMFLEALAQRYRVTVLVVPVFGQTRTSEAFARAHCEEVMVVEARRTEGFVEGIGARLAGMPRLLRLFESQADAAVAAVAGRRFDVVHAFRLYTAPVALAVARNAGASRLHLDLDDIESVTRERLAGLYEANDRPEEGAAERREARRFARAERRLLPRFQRVYACSEGDAALVHSIVRGEVRVVPNAVRPPETPRQRLTTHPFTFLFVGTLSYFPNEDAVRFFCTQVVPYIRQRTREPFLVRIVGTGLPESLRDLDGIPEVRLVGEVPDIAIEYAEADVAIVPIRGGGGTRIKVLEAFGYERAVVSTSIGIEGIEAQDGVHYLGGDSVRAFGSQCLRLMASEDLRGRIARAGRELVLGRYTRARVNERLAVDEPLAIEA